MQTEAIQRAEDATQAIHSKPTVTAHHSSEPPPVDGEHPALNPPVRFCLPPGEKQVRTLPLHQTLGEAHCEIRLADGRIAPFTTLLHGKSGIPLLGLASEWRQGSVDGESGWVRLASEGANGSAQASGYLAKPAQLAKLLSGAIANAPEITPESAGAPKLLGGAPSDEALNAWAAAPDLSDEVREGRRQAVIRIEAYNPAVW